ncbi:hypothetical protein K474DRAFT_1698445 [Panus rudis PR-1116 ss-1]|nr:hypothetical protein K474DRAFT_1698445 [Panus rudis PR-1116 ss-1]
MQPILILTRTFAICGIVVGAFAAPLPSSISGKSVQSLESREPTGFASVQPELVVLPEVAAREEKREPWHLCMGGCMRDLGDEEETSRPENRNQHQNQNRYLSQHQNQNQNERYKKRNESLGLSVWEAVSNSRPKVEKSETPLRFRLRHHLRYLQPPNSLIETHSFIRTLDRMRHTAVTTSFLFLLGID